MSELNIRLLLMKFNYSLTEATLLKRTLKFIAEISLPDKKRLLVRCPNLGDLSGCDILGSKVWFSQALTYEDLNTWELVEVDNGDLVCINEEHAIDIIIEGITKSLIPELQSYSLLQTNVPFENFETIDILLEEKTNQCYVYIVPIIYSNDKKEGLYPNKIGAGLKHLQNLISLKEEGKRTVLLFCVMHSGIDAVKPNENLDPLYSRLLSQAARNGVEILAYKTSISPEGIIINNSIPVLLSEDISER